MMESRVFRRHAGGGWGWSVVFGPVDAPDLYTGYARTQLGARFAVWNLSRPTLWSWLSYAIRPYDAVRDDRRWFFQRRQRCGFYSDLPSLLTLCDCPHHPCVHNPGRR